MPTQSIKLQAFLAHAGIASRRKAEELIAEGLVRVNGQVATIGQRIYPNQDQVTFQGKPVKDELKPVYVLINKRPGLVSTADDDLHRQTVLSLVPKELSEHRLYPVGRLDQESQGLMLLTDDGEVAYRLTHPKFRVPKTYLVQIDREPTDKAIEHLRRGVRLKEGMTSPAKVDEVLESDNPLVTDDSHWYTITIHEGRNRQVRRMFERIGYDVGILIRTDMGPLSLHDLEGETVKILDPDQVANLKHFLHLH